MRVGNLVKPKRPPKTWRLGVVEAVLGDGRCVVRSYVAPPNAYEGSIATHHPDDLDVVSLDRVVARLITVRAEAAAAAQLAEQIANALRAVERGLERCSCGGSAGQHAERCALAHALGL